MKVSVNITKVLIDFECPECKEFQTTPILLYGRINLISSSSNETHVIKCPCCKSKFNVNIELDNNYLEKR